ncbi:MAG: TetR/AcrR family transcriptional regulator [Proteobacteria bacterium]|nr:TetR/AcrR family transcriptional regulator [Pseudomonadota bacterium]NOG59277.1 TetR/AcrR family transcriptional regulator [Pseudomonadota bacterium]
MIVILSNEYFIIVRQAKNKNTATTKTFCRRKEARPSEIMKAALEEFSLNGFAATKLNDVAKRAGICKGTIYLYFKSKEELFEEVIKDRLLPNLEKMEYIGELSRGSAKDILREQLSTIYVALLSTDARHIPKLIIGEGSRFPELTEFYYKEIISRLYNIINTVIKQGVEAGEFRQSALNWKTQVIMSPVLSAVIWKTVFDEYAPMDLDAYLETHIELLLHGLEK